MDLGAVWSDCDIRHFWILVCLGEPTKRLPKVLECSATCPADRLHILPRRSHVFYFDEQYLPGASQSHVDRNGRACFFQRIFRHLVHHEYSFREDIKRRKHTKSTLRSFLANPKLFFLYYFFHKLTKK